MSLQNKEGIVVLSLFDGGSCGQIALQKLGVKVKIYYASEIDKYAQIVSRANFPETVYLGDVRNIDGGGLLKVDLMIGGSPCQSFSFAGKMKGMSTKSNIQITTLDQYLKCKKEGFEFEGQSYLFWEFMRLKQECNPKFFLLENVLMGEKWQTILSRAIGLNAIMINSSLVSAQIRKRLYWTNIGAIQEGLFGDLVCKIRTPEDKRVFLHHIIEEDVPEKYFLKQETIDKMMVWEQRNKDNGNGFGMQIRTPEDKAQALSTGAMKSSSTFLKVGAIKFGRTEEAKEIRKKAMAKGKDYTPFAKKEVREIDFEKMNTLVTNTGKDNLIIQLNQSTESQGTQPYQQNRVYGTEGKSPALMRELADHLILCEDYRIRRLTPLECARLQTMPDDYFWKDGKQLVSDTQIYKITGNGWTVDVIVWIFTHLPFYKIAAPGGSGIKTKAK